MDTVGRIHSVETMGALDGPGLRYVLFLQGCALRCRYCHNPDSWDFAGGSEHTVASLVAEIKEYQLFFGSEGGVTISGGEPLQQPEFTLALIEALRTEGIHTAVDTAGSVPLEISKPIIDRVDLLMLDIKSLDDKQAFSLTGMGNANTLATLAYAQAKEKPVWIRHVLVPGWTLEAERLTKLAEFLASFDTIREVELLPYHNLGAYKWEQLKIRYPFKDIPMPTEEALQEAQQIFATHGFEVLLSTHTPSRSIKVS